MDQSVEPLARADRSTITKVLEADIVFGRRLPDERLVEDDLIARFGATRHTVRRVIDDLSALGLVTREPNRGARVVSFAPSEIDHLYEIRGLLQAQAIRRMELPVPSDTIAEMRRCHEGHLLAAADGDNVRVFEWNNAFHAAFFDACGNPLLSAEIAAFAWRTHPIRSLGFTDPDYIATAQDEHAAIIEAAIAGDRNTLVTIDQLHMMRPKDAYIASMIARS